MGRRIFVGLPVDAHAAHELAAFARRHLGSLPVRAIDPGMLHATLVFCGPHDALCPQVRALVARARETGAEVLVAGDSSCLMHIGGLLSRQRSGVRVMHLAEVLASTDGSPSAEQVETRGRA